MDNYKINDMSLEELQTTVSMLSQEIEATKIIREQIAKFTAADNLEDAINDMLATIGTYMKAERIYIFEERGSFYPNTYEWCAKGISSEKDSLQDLTREDIIPWTRVLEKGKCIYIPCVEDIKDSMPDIYALLARQNISCVVEAPIIMENKLVGFLGVDNAPAEITKLIADSLATLGAFLGITMQVRQKQEKIKKQNIALQREEKKYRNALSNKCEYCFSFDVTEGLIYETFTTAHGVNIFEKLGLSLPVSFDELSSKYLSACEIEILDPETLSFYNSEGLLKEFEKGITKLDSEYFSPISQIYCRLSILLSLDETTNHVYAVVIANDTTEVRKREARQLRELIETQERLRVRNEELRISLQSEKEKTAIISAMSNIYYSSYLIDLKDGMITEISSTPYQKKFIKSNGKAEDALQAWIDHDLNKNFAEDVETFTNLATLPKRMADTQIINFDCISKLFGWIRISFIAVSRDKNNAVRQVLWVSQHIDSEKQKELAQQEALKAAYDAANQANSAKTNFLANMSHDIRTPMNAIIGMTAIAGTHLDDKERVADCLGKITVSSKHLLGLINEVLDMSKIEAGKMDLHDEEFSLPKLIDNLLTMVRPQIKVKNHEFSVSIREIEHEQVIGDIQRIQQVFMNLMSNAIKYTPDGGKISLSISEKPTNQPKLGCYEFIFEDNGIGMSKDFLSHIFEPFTRAPDKYIEQVQGTGLGMAITKNMVQMMNGDIKVESEPDKGTKITVSIIMKLQNTNEKISYEKFIDLPVLVADSRDACEAACEILKDLGMKCEWVLSGTDAVDLAVSRHKEKRDFFAIIIDWKTPELNGIETTKKIRELIGDEMPIIVISAYDWSDIELEARSAGANAFISKPLFKSRMAHLFHDLLGDDQEEPKNTSLNDIDNEEFMGKRVLLVEDNDLNAEIAGEILGMVGLTVDYTKNGKEALDIISEAKDDYYDIIFMDIQMPIMNGYEATTAIRALPGNYAKRVPIIAMTANAFTEDILNAKNAGMNQHMAKPLNFNELIETLRKWLS